MKRVVTATSHAKDRALERYGVELSDAMWEDLAGSIQRGEHLRVHTDNDADMYEVMMQRSDRTVFMMTVLVSRKNGKIISVLPADHCKTRHRTRVSRSST